MLTSLNEQKSIKEIRRLIDNSDKIVIVTHTAPDGDAIGSSTALRTVLTRLGKNVDIVIPDMMLITLRSVPGAKDVVDATKYPEFARQLIDEANLFICLDFNELKRIGKIGDLIKTSSAPKILIDHHLNPSDFADVIISHPEMCSTCFLLFKVLCALGLFNEIDKAAATSILTGMMTDTGNFSYNCNDPEIYKVVAELVSKGADKEQIYRQQFETKSFDCLRLNSYALLEKTEIWPELGASLISLTRAELNQFHYVKGDTEGLVNRPLAIPGIVFCAFLREEDNYVKVSMRSVGDFPVNEVCADYFGGGGHKNAAGGEFQGTMQECIDLYKSILDKLKTKYIPNHKKPKNE